MVAASAQYPVPKKLGFEVVPGLDDAISEAGKNIDRLFLDTKT